MWEIFCQTLDVRLMMAFDTVVVFFFCFCFDVRVEAWNVQGLECLGN